MVSLIFGFNKEKVAAAGLTTDELLQPMREHAEKYGIEEAEYGVFQMDGEDAVCVLIMFVGNMVRKDPKYIGYLDKWILDIDGEEEDCIEETYKYYAEHKPNVKLG